MYLKNLFKTLCLTIILSTGCVFFVQAAGLETISQLPEKEGTEKMESKLNKVLSKMKKLTPNFMVKDVNKTIDFYKQNLEFEFVMGVDESKNIKMGDFSNSVLTFAILKNNNVEIMLQREDSLIEELPEFKEIKVGGTFTLYINIQDVKSFYEKVKGKVEIIKDIHKTFYGSDEFVIKDLNGYIIYFAEAQQG